MSKQPTLTQSSTGKDASIRTTSTVSNDSLVEGAGKITLEKANMWGRGIVEDFKSTIGTHWRSEMSNFNQKTIAVTLLLFISVIAPTLTFGVVYGKVTENNIGAIETIVGTAWVGITYSLIGGMPMVSFRSESYSDNSCACGTANIHTHSLALRFSVSSGRLVPSSLSRQ